VVARALQHLSNFNTSLKLQEAIITFIVGQLAKREDTIDLQKAFKALDVDNDGMLSKAELIRGYQEINWENPEEEVEKVFAKVDIDGSGFIDYSEWVVATINKEKLLTKEKLHATFNVFDKDGGGTISAKEVREILCLGQQIDDEMWNRVV
jgi:calcium-dependent protein kinase